MGSSEIRSLNTLFRSNNDPVFTELHCLKEHQKYGSLKHPVKGELVSVTKCISELGKATRFGPGWQGERCGAKTRRGTECQRPAYKHNGRCGLHGCKSTGAKTTEGLQHISEANLKHDRYTKYKLAARRKRGEVGRHVNAELKLTEQRLIEAGLLDT